MLKSILFLVVLIICKCSQAFLCFYHRSFSRPSTRPTARPPTRPSVHPPLSITLSPTCYLILDRMQSFTDDYRPFKLTISYLNLQFCAQDWYGSRDEVKVISVHKVAAVRCNSQSSSLQYKIIMVNVAQQWSKVPRFLRDSEDLVYGFAPKFSFQETL